MKRLYFVPLVSQYQFKWILDLYHLLIHSVSRIVCEWFPIIKKAL